MAQFGPEAADPEWVARQRRALAAYEADVVDLECGPASPVRLEIHESETSAEAVACLLQSLQAQVNALPSTINLRT